jgi:hypothetical protein
VSFFDVAKKDGWHIIVLFPWQTDEKKKVLFSDQFRTLAAFNVELNARINRDPTVENQMVVCWTDYIFKIRGVTGSIYIVWASEMSIYVQGDNEIDKWGRHIPLLSNTDAHFGQKAFYAVMSGMSSYEVLFISPDRVNISQQATTILYPCDTRAVATNTPTAKPLDSHEARVRRERLVIPDHEREQYQTSTPPPPLADGLGYFVSSSVGVSDTYHEFETPSTDDDGDVSISDDISEFFGAESTPPPNPVDGDVAHSRVALSLSSIVSTDNEDGCYVPPGAITQRNRVPRSLVPRSDQRGAVGRVRFVPAKSAVKNIELRPETMSTTSGESSPIISARGIQD